jgi:hypothetical protein
MMITVSFDISGFGGVATPPVYYVQIFGWLFMTFGFALVLYSRLHIVILNPRATRILLPHLLSVLIVVNGIGVAFLIATAYVSSPRAVGIIGSLAIKFESLAPAQEIVLATLYIYFSYALLYQGSFEEFQSGRSIFYFLSIVQIAVILCDVAVIVTVFEDLVFLRQVINPMYYAIKLEFEFVVLNRLVQLLQRRDGRLEEYIEDTGNQNSSGPISSSIAGLNVDRSNPIIIGTTVLNENMVASALRLPTDASDDIQLKHMDSMEDLERRYLGRQGIEIAARECSYL